MPGHTLAVLVSYPELGCTGKKFEVGHKWGIYHEVLCLGNEKAYNFVKDVIDELCDIFSSKYIHIGGDETPITAWTSCAKDQALAKSTGLTIDKLRSYFTNRVEKHVNSKGRRIIGWGEILDGPINKSATVMSWRGAEPGQEAAKLGHDVIMAPTDNCYLDYPQVKTSEELK